MDQDNTAELRRAAVDAALLLVSYTYQREETPPPVSADVLLKNAEAIYQFLIAGKPTSTS